MNDIAIRVENLSKRYRIGQRERYLTLRDVLARSFTAPFRLFRRDDQSPVPNSQSKSNYIWALKDVSFEVKRGEVVGIIGRNGAGKTTLLKILSRITEPTEGYAEVRGRVGSLLEVGTGFHPELTGRENIYLSGAILGMKKREIDRKFDEIVAFAEVEKFIDTPVKHYSSGMYVRLAFAVAAHLEPEILLVDEVLAVGDAAFQKKCLGKMGDVAKEGRTVLFVSHNMGAIQSLCERVMLLRNGRLVGTGEPTEIITMYMSEMHEVAQLPISDRSDREGNGKIRIIGLTVNGVDNASTVTVCAGDTVQFVLDYVAKDRPRKPSFHIGIYDAYGVSILHLSSRVVGCVFENLDLQGRVSCTIPRLPLRPGHYTVNVAVLEESTLLDRVEAAMEMNVTKGDFYGSGDTSSMDWGICLVDHYWEVVDQ